MSRKTEEEEEEEEVSGELKSAILANCGRPAGDGAREVRSRFASSGPAERVSGACRSTTAD
jgi:hypothetical protein